MAKVTVTPETFTMVNYDAGEIRSAIEELADRVGVPADAEVVVDIEEKTPLGRSRLTSTSPITISIEGGAIEEPTRLRHWSRRNTELVAGRLLLRANDRLGSGFEGAPGEDELTVAQQAAWDAYSFGRLQRLGYDGRKPRAIYHFRNRHGFNDAADAVFERLWNAEQLTWADLAAACDETAAAKATA